MCILHVLAVQQIRILTIAVVIARRIWLATAAWQRACGDSARRHRNASNDGCAAALSQYPCFITPPGRMYASCENHECFWSCSRAVIVPAEPSRDRYVLGACWTLSVSKADFKILQTFGRFYIVNLALDGTLPSGI